MTSSKKIIAIHQPNFLPWSGYIHKIISSHVFVLMDNVQFSKESWINRVQIKTNQGPIWISVPVNTSQKLQQKINEVEICNNTKWNIKILRTFEMNYRRSSFWSAHSAFITETFSKQWPRLIDLNLHCLKYLLNALDIKTEIILMSTLPVDGKKSDLLCEICRILGGTTYLSGAQAADYNNPEIFRSNGIELTYQNYKHPVYPQQHGVFVPGLSTLDLLLNYGPQSRELLLTANTPSS